MAVRRQINIWNNAVFFLNCKLHLWEQTSVKFESKYDNSNSRKKLDYYITSAKWRTFSVDKWLYQHCVDLQVDLLKVIS